MAKGDKIKEQYEERKRAQERDGRLSQPPKKIVKSEELRIQEAKDAMFEMYHRYHAICGDKTLQDQKTQKAKDAETRVVTDMSKAASELENINPGEGLMSICILLLRELIVFRNKINNIEHALSVIQEKDK